MPLLLSLVLALVVVEAADVATAAAADAGPLLRPEEAAATAVSSGDCPAGYFGNASLHFSCAGAGEKRGGFFSVLLLGNSSGSSSSDVIPAGVVNLTIDVQAQGAHSVFVLDATNGRVLASSAGSSDASSNASVANGTGGSDVNANGTGANGSSDVAAAAARRPHLAPIRVTTGEGWTDTITITGQSARELVLVLASRSGTPNNVILRYNYQALSSCPPVPLGCVQYDGLAARDAVSAWSAWASSAYASAEGAWRGLCTELLLAAGLAEAAVPPKVWAAVWARWPEAQPPASGQWRLAFRFVDALGVQDGLVSFAEFSRAFDLVGVSLSVFNFCTRLHANYPNASNAWQQAMLADAPADAVTWDAWSGRVWSSFSPPDNFQKASAQDAFQFVDASGTGNVSRGDFENVWDSCHNTYRAAAAPPPPPPPPAVLPTTVGAAQAARPGSAAAVAPAPPPPLPPPPPPPAGDNATTTTGAPAAAAVTVAGSSVGGAPAGAAANASEANASEANASSANASTANASTANASTANASTANASTAGVAALEHTTTASPGALTAAQSPPACCEESRAECLACQVGQSPEALCATAPAFGALAGCPGGGGGDDWQRPTPPAAAIVSDGCPYTGMALGPPMADSATTQENTSAACQARCRRTLGCTFFTYWQPQGHCVLQGPGARLSVAAAAISGPAACAADVRLRFAGVDFDALSGLQLAELRKRLGAALAAALGLDTPQDLHADDDGAVAEVSLAAGSLLASCRATLPVGGDTRLVSAAVAAATPELVSALTAVNVSGVGAGPEVTVATAPTCFLWASKYVERAIADPTNTMSEVAFSYSLTTNSPQECQSNCTVQPACTRFTFWQGSRRCLLFGDDVLLVPDASATAGPARCPLPPRPPLASAGSGASAAPVVQITAASHAISRAVGDFTERQPDIMWAGLALVVVFSALVLVLCVRRVAGSGRRKGGHRYEALPRGGEHGFDDGGDEEAKAGGDASDEGGGRRFGDGI